jgi:hypothetical protein
MASMDAALEQRLAAVEDRLRAQLSEEEFRLVRELRCLDELITMAACDGWQRLVLEALVRHFPDHELALRGVIQHVITTEGDCDTLQGLGTGGHGR